MGETARYGTKWKVIGTSVTSPLDQKTRKEVFIDDLYVVVGFEVNNLDAFLDGKTHDLAKDYGHAFFYLVKNHEVISLFSFGPAGPGKVGWGGKGSTAEPNKYNIGAFLKDGYKDSRPGNPEYRIQEKVTAFKLPVNLAQAAALVKEVNKWRKKIYSGKEKYTAFMNDTCAETARDILTSAGIESPSATGYVKHSGIVNFPVAYAANPYMWHHNFEKTSLKKTTFVPSTGSDAGWLPKIGSEDVIF